MVQTMKEYQKEYFEKEGYTIIDNMEYGGKADERKQTCDMEPRQSNRGCILSDVRELD